LNILRKAVPGSVGKPLTGYEVKIIDENGNELLDGKAGIFPVKGGSTATHYLRHYEKTQKTFRGEWVPMEDLFSKDKEGNLYFFALKDDLPKVSGYFIPPLEIEKCIATHPDIPACAVVGVKDSDGLDKTKVYIVLRGGVVAFESMADQIIEYAKRKMPENCRVISI
jgi:acyl-coenzyme A synthetase/AMP-(fatty) acid ligase